MSKALWTVLLAAFAVGLPPASGWIIQQGLELPAAVLACFAVLPFVFKG